jgi:hypothetical protein
MSHTSVTNAGKGRRLKEKKVKKDKERTMKNK